MFFGQKPQISSEQKIAQAEAEIDMVSDMYSRYVLFSLPMNPLNPSTSTQTLMLEQPCQILHGQMHRHVVPRGGSQQGRVGVPGSLRVQVLRGQCQG